MRRDEKLDRVLGWAMLVGMVGVVLLVVTAVIVLFLQDRGFMSSCVTTVLR